MKYYSLVIILGFLLLAASPVWGSDNITGQISEIEGVDDRDDDADCYHVFHLFIYNNKSIFSKRELNNLLSEGWEVYQITQDIKLRPIWNIWLVREICRVVCGHRQ